MIMISLKFVDLAVRKIWCMMCVSINMGPVWNWYASRVEVGNLRSEFGHARPFGSRIILYLRDGRTDRQTDRQTGEEKQRYGRRDNNAKRRVDNYAFHASANL